MRILLYSKDRLTYSAKEVMKKAKELAGIEEGLQIALLGDDQVPPRGATVLAMGAYKRRGMERVVTTYSVGQLLSKGDSLTRMAQALNLCVSVPELPEFKWEVILSPQRLQHMFKTIRGQLIAVDIETRGQVDAQIPGWEHIISIGVYDGDTAYIIPENVIQSGHYTSAIREVLESSQTILHNGKFDGKYLGIYPVHDTMLLHYALEPAASSHGLKELAKQYFGAEDWDSGNAQFLKGETYGNFSYAELTYGELTTLEDLGAIFLEDGSYALPMKYPSKSGYERIPRRLLYKYNAWDVYWTYWLYKAMMPELKQDENAQKVYKHLMSLSEVYQDIEAGGVRFDVEYMEQFKLELEAEAQRLEKEFCVYFGKPVNPRSPKQVKEAFAELGYVLESTNAATMQELADSGEVGAQLLMKLRENNKILGTYIKGYLDKLIDGKGYQTFKLHASITGRLGGGGPSMLTIPRNKKVKRMVLPDEGHVMVGADASQMELRIMALESQDPWLIAAFQPEAGDFFDNIIKQAYPDIDPVAFKAEDIGAYTDLRAKIKGTIYGKSFNRGEKAIAQSLGISLDEAQKLSDAFIRPGSEFAQWRAMIERKAILGQPIVNKMGRRFQSELITRKNRQSVINSAMSHISQSTGNDLLLNALKNVVPRCGDYGARVMGTIHDAIYLSCPPETAEEAGRMVSEEIIHSGTEMYGTQLQFVSDWGVGNNLSEV